MNRFPDLLKMYKKYPNFDFSDKEYIKKGLKIHKLMQIVYYQISNNLIEHNFSEDDIEDMKNFSILEMLNMKMHFNNIEKIFKKFNEAGIKVIALKGLVLKEYYEIPELRLMRDADILIDEKDLERIDNILVNLGYEFKSECSHHKVYKKENYLRLEIHTSITNELYNAKNKNPFKSSFEKSRKIKFGDETVFALDYTDQLMHLITHIIGHIKGGVISLKQLLDITLFINSEENNIDFKLFKSIGEICGFYKFSLGIFSICEEYLDCNIPSFIKKDFSNITEEYKEVILDILFKRGLEIKDAIVETIIYGSAYANGNYDKNSFQRYLKYIFPPIDVIKKNYTYCDKYKFLLPVAWIHRMFVAKSIRGKSIYEKINILIKSIKGSKKKSDELKILDI